MNALGNSPVQAGGRATKKVRRREEEPPDVGGDAVMMDEGRLKH